MFVVLLVPLHEYKDHTRSILTSTYSQCPKRMRRHVCTHIRVHIHIPINKKE